MQQDMGMPAGAGNAAPPAAQSAMTFGEARDASPEEQALYEKFVAKATMLVYDEKMFGQVLNMLKAGNPIETVGQTAAMVVGRVALAAKQAGQSLPGDVLMAAGKEVVEDLVDLTEKAGIHEFSNEELEGAYFRALDVFREMMEQAGYGDRQAAEREFAMLQQANESGELEAGLMRLAEREAQMNGAQQPQQQGMPTGGLGAAMGGR